MEILSEVNMTMLDTTTDNASTTAHGFVPKGTNTGTKFLRDDLTWADPPSSSGIDRGKAFAMAQLSHVYY